MDKDSKNQTLARENKYLSIYIHNTYYIAYSYIYNVHII